MEQYPNLFGMVRFRRIQNDGNELQLRTCPDKRCDTAVPVCAKGRNHWGGRGALECRCVGEDMEFPFVRFRKEVDYERQVVEWLAWMRGQCYGLGDKLHLDYFVVSVQFDRVWFVDRHEYFACD